STITHNAAVVGGGVAFEAFDSSSRDLFRNTIVAGNQAASGPDVNGNVTSLGYNLIGQTDGSTGWLGTDHTGTGANPLDPQLGPLQDNGGRTPTHALLLGSPAIGMGDPAVQTTTDQRGSVRVYGHSTDIGAFETEDAVSFRLAAPSQVTAGVPFSV